jgi:hypothetical protein
MRAKPKPRPCKVIGIKIFEDTDADILDWWESIEMGERSDALRDVIRFALGHAVRGTKRVEVPELKGLRDDTLWIRDAINAMPNYLEQLIAQAITRLPRDVSATLPSSPTVLINEPALSNSESSRRTQRLKRATW